VVRRLARCGDAMMGCDDEDNFTLEEVEEIINVLTGIARKAAMVKALQISMRQQGWNQYKDESKKKFRAMLKYYR